MAQQYAPIGTESAKKMCPVKFVCAALKNMRNVGAIEPLSLHDVCFHPEHFFGRTNFDTQAKQFLIVRPLKPGIIDLAKAISGTKNQIHTIPATCGFGEPVWKCFFRGVSDASECIEGCIDIVRSKVQIDIFCMARNACVKSERRRASN